MRMVTHVLMSECAGVNVPVDKISTCVIVYYGLMSKCFVPVAIDECLDERKNVPERMTCYGEFCFLRQTVL